MKYSRLLIGAFVVGIASWIVVGEQVSQVSANAYINAQIVTVRSDRAGKISLPPRTLGSSVLMGETLAKVVNLSVDSSRLNDLELERAHKAAEVASMSRRLEVHKEVLAGLRNRSSMFRAFRVEEARIRLTRAQRRLAVLQERNSLQSQGPEAAAWVVEPFAREPDSYELALEHAHEEVEISEIVLEAAERGVFLGDGYNDAPSAEQHATKLSSEIQLQAATLQQLEAQYEALVERLGLEKLRVEELQVDLIRAPASGTIWELIATNEVRVERGDPILRIVDCSSTIVSLSVSEMTYNSLKIGDDASFRFNNDRRVFKGTITRLSGSGAKKIYDTLAVVPGLRHLERFDVTVSVPELASEPELACAIGRTGRVFFEPRPLDIIRKFLR